jgi:hypothetical protein
MNDKTRYAVATSLFTVSVLSAAYYIKTLKTERAKRREIDKNLQLDLAAIRLASERLKIKLDCGDYDKNFYRFFEDMQNEIEFQKIAIREK